MVSQMNRPLYIFDLDGTLALTEHRSHLVRCENPDWKAFFAACVDDEPNIPVVNTLLALLESGAEIRIWTGRSSEVMEQTQQWLMTHLGDAAESIEMCMRIEGDYTPDEEIKATWYDALREIDKRSLVAIFDDRQKVVDMWRDKGVACFQVAPGNF